MVNLTIAQQLQANCLCHTSPLMQHGCTTTFSQEKDDFQSITQAAWKTENYVFATGVQLMTFWLIVQILYYYYATGDWWERRVLSQVHVQFPSNRSNISTRYSVLTTCIEQSMLWSPITVQYKFLSRANLKSKSFHKMDVFFI